MSDYMVEAIHRRSRGALPQDRDVDPLDHRHPRRDAGLYRLHVPPRARAGTPERAFVFGWHKTWGALILVLALIRLAVRLMNPPPPYPSDYPKWKRFAAVWNHRFFYFLLIALPLTGLAAVSGRAEDGWVALQLGLELPAIPGIAKENGVRRRPRSAGLDHAGAGRAPRRRRRSTTSSSIAGRAADRMWPFRRSNARRASAAGPASPPPARRARRRR